MRLRRPSDLALEAGPRRGPRRGAGWGQPPPGWPEAFSATAEDRVALLVLLGLAAMTPRRLLELAAECGTARACLREVRSGRAGSEGDRTFARTTDPEAVAERVRACGARLVAPGDPEYPAELLDLSDPPAGLFVLGRLLQAGALRVAVVGARSCSPAGREVAAGLCRALARAGVTVVSGAARGIDGAAHRGALDGGGPTVAVLGCGIDVAYPPQHRRLLSQVAEAGSVVSEYPPGTPAEPSRFPARNRIVAALCRAVVVVEGAQGSGSMITADHALEIGREVFAVPGSVTSPLSAVPLSLIRDGATMVRGPADLLSDLGLTAGEADAAGGIPVDLEPAQLAVWEALAGPTAPDEVGRRSGLSVSEVIPALVGLELRGLVRQVGGRYERRLDR